MQRTFQLLSVSRLSLRKSSTMAKTSSVISEMASIGRQMDELATHLKRFKEICGKSDNYVVYDESAPLCIRIFQRSSKNVKDLTDDELINEYKALYQMLQEPEIAEVSDTIPKRLSSLNRLEATRDLYDWLGDNGVNLFKIEIFQTSDGRGLGVKSKTKIDIGESVIKIPRKCTMNVEEFSKMENLKDLKQSEPMLNGLPNVFLAVSLLSECYKEKNSFYHPYISSLPASHSNVCYYTIKNWESLRGTSALREGIMLWRHMVRQFAYLKTAFESFGKKLPSNGSLFLAAVQALGFKDRFCFADYQWAVATVMTRVNYIPTSIDPNDPDKKRQHTLAFIPLMDFFNHDYCTPNVDFDIDSDCCEILAAESYTTDGQEIFINYGNRSDIHVLLHNGFLPSFNYVSYIALDVNQCLQQKYDGKIQLVLNDKRLNILKRINLHFLELIPIYPDPNPWFDLIVCWMRTMVADESLLHRLTEMSDKNLVEAVSSKDKALSDENEKLAIGTLLIILESRLKPLLQSEKSDEELFSLRSNDPASMTNSEELAIFHCISYRRRERSLLRDAIKNLKREYPFLESSPPRSADSQA